MKKFINALFKNADDRMKSPLISSFVFSWIILNWKPISIYLFSAKSIENKISYILDQYSNICLNVIMPLTFSIIYTLFFPYLNWFIKKFLSYAIDGITNELSQRKANEINSYIIVEVANINLEDTKLKAREKNNLNETSQELTKKNNELLEELKNQRVSNREYIEELRSEIKERDTIINDLTNSREDYEMQKYNYETQISDLTSEINNLQSELAASDKFLLSPNVLIFQNDKENGLRLTRDLSDHTTLKYIDEEGNIYLQNDIRKLINTYPHTVGSS